MIPIIQVSSNSTKPTAAVKATAVPVAHGGGQMVRRTPLQAVGHQCLECYDPFFFLDISHVLEHMMCCNVYLSMSPPTHIHCCV